LNGRVFGDIFGSFTCFTPNGSSNVDYVIASEEILNDILYFRVSEFMPTLSDTHCKLSWAISARYKIVKNSDWVNTHSLNQIAKTGDVETGERAEIWILKNSVIKKIIMCIKFDYLLQGFQQYSA
jgi:hypothetical protein